MNIIILGGFLGAGKTTVLLQLADFLTRKTFRPGRTSVVILENEISDAGVDNQLLAEREFTVKNVFSGCICCSGSGDLSRGVREIADSYGPDWLLIEATGLAYPDVIRKSLRRDGFKETGILAVADVKRWSRVARAMKTFAESQVSDADIILLNKSDLAGRETCERVDAEIAALNPRARRLPFTAIRDYPDSFWEELTETLSGGGKKDGQDLSEDPHARS